MRKRILISGGAGYVGRDLTKLLYEEHDVCVVDKLNFGAARMEKLDPLKYKMETSDILDLPSISRIIKLFQPDVIIHLAATHFIPLCEEKPGDATATNLVGLLNLLSVCPADCRFVFASSGAVYAPSTELHDEERSVIGPMDVYGLNKLHGEQYVRYFAEKNGFPSVIVRLFNVVGPGETNPHLLPEIIAQLKSGATRVKLGNLTPKRDYIHVLDAASGFSAAALRGDVASGEVVIANLGTSKQYAVSEIIERLRNISAVDFFIDQEPSRMRAVDRPFLGAAIDRIRARFGWTPDFGIEDALVDLWRDPDLSAELSTKYGLQI